MRGVSVLVRSGLGSAKEAVRVCDQLCAHWPLYGFRKPEGVERSGAALFLAWSGAVSDRLDYDYMDLFRALSGVAGRSLHGVVSCIGVPGSCCYRIERDHVVLLYDQEESADARLADYLPAALDLSNRTILEAVVRADLAGALGLWSRSGGQMKGARIADNALED